MLLALSLYFPLETHIFAKTFIASQTSPKSTLFLFTGKHDKVFAQRLFKKSLPPALLFYELSTINLAGIFL